MVSVLLSKTIFYLFFFVSTIADRRLSPKQLSIIFSQVCYKQSAVCEHIQNPQVPTAKWIIMLHAKLNMSV